MEDKNLRISCSEGVLYYEWWNEELDCYERLTINSVLWKSEYRNIRNGINAGIWEKIISDLKCNHILKGAQSVSRLVRVYFLKTSS